MQAMSGGGKAHSMYRCNNCGAQSPRWQGRCSLCEQWNTLEQIQSATPMERRRRLSYEAVATREISQISIGSSPRILSPFDEMNRVLGGGIVPGSVVLMAGDPGIGKSTLLLQASDFLTKTGGRVLYVSGEESGEQIRLRAERLGINGDGIFFLSETEPEIIIEQLDQLDPVLVVIDSIQTMFSRDISSAMGSVAQVRDCARRFMDWAKRRNIPVFLAGHVTKDGSVAGPRALEHMVDVVLYLEGDTLSAYRLLRGVKNRFGSTNEIGVFQMGGNGLQEVSDPSQLFLSRHGQEVAGSVVIVTMEGTRPLLAEVQALCTRTVFSQPRRVAAGIDFHRLLLITAVLGKRLGLSLSDQDIIVNMAGGLTVSEPAVDLGIALAMVSSFGNVACDPWTVAIGEIGLSGEIRSIPHLERRLHEAAKLGFRRAIVPVTQGDDSSRAELEVLEAHTLTEAIRAALPDYLNKSEPAMVGRRRP